MNKEKLIKKALALKLMRSRRILKNGKKWLYSLLIILGPFSHLNISFSFEVVIMLLTKYITTLDGGA